MPLKARHVNLSVKIWKDDLKILTLLNVKLDSWMR